MAINVGSERGEKLRDLFRRRSDVFTSPFVLGIEVRPVTFADHRSGWSAVRLTLNLGWWHWSFSLVRWPTPRRRVRILSLREQLHHEHGDDEE